MALLTGILILATLIAFGAVLFGQDRKKNFKTFMVALALLIISAAITGNNL